MRSREFLHVPLREVGMNLDLIDRRHGRGAIEELFEVLDHEIADPDRSNHAVLEQSLQGAVGLHGSVECHGSAWWRMSRSIWSTPSLRALFSKPCRVSSYP